MKLAFFPPTLQEPDAPLLDSSYFKVVIANEHKIQSQDSEALRRKFAEKNRLQSEIQQLESAIAKTKEELQTTNFRTASDRRVVSNRLNNLIEQKKIQKKIDTFLRDYLKNH
jgi:valyl-tRNA synthetase